MWTIVYLTSFIALTLLIVAFFPFAFEWVKGEFFNGVPAPDTGEIFAGVGALFSAIAFAGILMTIVLQSRELSLQRLELEETRGELSRQADALELQQFENTFFQMLTLHHDIVRGMVETRRGAQAMSITATPGPDRRWEGRAVLGLAVKSLRSYLIARAKEHPESSVHSIAKGAYQSLYEEYGNFLGHYFRNLYQIIKLVDFARIKDKARYSSLARAQLSGTELELLFFNCLSDYGHGFKPYVEKYALLEHVPLGEVVTANHLALYDETAFGSRKSLLLPRQRAISEGARQG